MFLKRKVFTNDAVLLHAQFPISIYVCTGTYAKFDQLLFRFRNVSPMRL